LRAVKDPHCLDNRLTDGGSLRTDRGLLPRNVFPVTRTHFCQRLSKPPGLLRLEVFGVYIYIYIHMYTCFRLRLITNHLYHRIISGEFTATIKMNRPEFIYLLVYCLHHNEQSNKIYCAQTFD
jgi:hypothetical protein